MEMECELLISNFKNPKTIDLVNQNIGQISDGSSAHSAGALKLGLKKAFDRKKQKQQPPPVGTMLLCASPNCAWNSGPGIPYSSIGSFVVCPECDAYYMKCVACGNHRRGNYASCQSCKKPFV